MDRDQAAALIAQHRIETVKVGTPDMDGVYRGKRVSAQQFLDNCDDAGFAQCDVIFGWDIAEEIISDPLEIGSADNGFSDVVLQPDLATLRVVPWEPGVAAVVCDARSEDGAPVAVSPRAVLRRVVERARAMGYEPMTAVEYEFRIFREDQHSLREKRFSNLTPLNPGFNCYSISHASIDEEVVGDIRRNMDAYRVEVEGYNREHGEGMYEINLRYASALEAADRAMLFKSATREICARHGAVPTFMAKYSDQMDGCSGHVHQSLWKDGANTFHDAADAHGMSAIMKAYLAGLLETLPELFALYAPNVNSYSRYVAGSWAPTAVTWGIDNRTAALRIIAGSAGATRIENRVPGADVSGYLGFAACLAGGLSGIERGRTPPPPRTGDVYKSEGAPSLPSTLSDAIDRLDASQLARDWFGDAFVDHYVAMRRWEVERRRRAVTEWERRRYFEQV